MLKKWGLPENIFEPIKYHHNSQKIPENCEVKARILWLADRISSVYHGSQCVEKIKEINSSFSQFYGFCEEEINRLVDEVATKSVEILSYFEIDSGDMKPYSQLLLEANEELGKLNISYEELILELKRSKEKPQQGDKEMALEENKGLVNRFAKAWEKGDMDEMDRIIADDFVFHGAPPGVKPDREGYKEFVGKHLAAFPDFSVTIEDILAEGDRVAHRVTWTGTHKGEYMGIAPTGKPVTVTVVSIVRIEDGRIAAQWAQADVLAVMRRADA